MRFNHPTKHMSSYSIVAFALSFIVAILFFTPVVKAADDFTFTGSVDASVPIVDGKTQYGPVSVILTDFTTSKKQTIILPAETPMEAISGSTQGIVNFKYKFSNLSKTDTYQVCIVGATPSLCTAKIGPSEQVSYFNFDKTAIIANINVSIQNLKDNPNIIPVKAAASTTATTSTCDIPGVGWIICPVVRFMANMADSAFGFLSDNFLNTSPSILNTDASAKNADGTLVGTTTYQAWQIIRNIANVAFVIAFLIIIFSQVTNFGVTNYGVKKMLPRLIIAAILVNISFFICQIAVDLSNIFGYSLENMLAGLAPASASTGDGTFSGNSWTNYAGGALVLGASGAIVWATLAALIPALLAAILALVMILFILIGRQAVIILLVIISPLAFVAFILPNTEKLFKTWQKTATSMLLLFPIIAVVFGVSKLASTILSSVFSANNNTIGGIAAAAVMVLPLFIVPSLLKKSLDAIPALGQFANKLSSKANSNLGKQVGNAYSNTSYARGREIRKSAKSQRRTADFARRVQDNSLTSLAAGGLTGLGAAALGRRAPGSWQAQRNAVASSARSAVATADAKDLNDEMTLLEIQRSQAQVAEEARPGGVWENDKYLANIASNADGKSTPLKQKAALHTLAKIGSADKLRELRKDPRVDQTSLQSAISANTSALVTKAPDLVKGNAGAFNNITGAGLSAFTPGTAQAHMEYLSSLYDKSIAPGATRADEEAFAGAESAFNSAVTDITNNPTLQAAFNKDAGIRIQRAAAPRDAANHNLEMLISDGFRSHIDSGGTIAIAAIQSDGKIR